MMVSRREHIPRIRLLPVLLVAILMSLTVKVGHVWRGVAHWRGAPAATAGQAGAGAAEPLENAVRPAPLGAATATAAGGKAAGDAAGPPIATPGAAAQLASIAEPPRDPTRFTQAEIDLLQALASRRDALEKRDRTLDEREQIVAAAEKHLDDKAASLEAMRSELMKLVTQRSDADEAKLRSLVKIYEIMKPRDAAQIFDKLDLDIAVGVLGRMRENRAAPILAGMAADRAKTVTALLIDHKDPPAQPGR